MTRCLKFYHKSVFNSLKTKLTRDGFRIVSISNCLTIESAKKVNPNQQIVDLSAIGHSFGGKGSLEMQLLFEQVFPIFNKGVEFIADLVFLKEYEYHLRFCFDSFVEMDLSLSDKELVDKVDHIDVKRIVSLNKNELNDFVLEFNSSLYGHETFKSDLESKVDSFRIFNMLGEHKVLSLFLMGESGVGKTEVARQIFKGLKGEAKLAKINFGNYSSKDSLNSLIGSPRGYIGSEGGELFNRVNNSDVGLILVDEFEKSNSSVFNYFLDVLENGKLTNSQGEEIDVNGYIFVFTSNMSKEDYFKRISPELRSRFDLVCEFLPLSIEDKQKFVVNRLSNIFEKYNKHIDVKLSKAELSKLINVVDVSKFTNMRNLNGSIKDVFVNYLRDKSTSLEMSNKDVVAFDLND